MKYSSISGQFRLQKSRKRCQTVHDVHFLCENAHHSGEYANMTREGHADSTENRVSAPRRPACDNALQQPLRAPRQGQTSDAIRASLDDAGSGLPASQNPQRE